MRTTTAVDELLESRLEEIGSKKRSQGNRRLRKLEKSYSRASRGKQAEEFDLIDRENWPQ